MKSFASRIVRWQQRHGRHTLPWQGTRDPYRIWLSEIMLQQTQVTTVIPYFERFVARFPDLASLAAAHEDEVLALWSGLGYYSRARNLHAAARAIRAGHDGNFPAGADAIEQLPGIGRSTAAAIAALAFGRRVAILDGNVKRVLARHGGIAGWPGDKKVETALWQLAESYLPRTAIEAYTQGMMDLGALVCTRSQPACSACPVNTDCTASTQQRTAELPTPRPRKALPERQVQMLLLLDRGELMLEKRPARGVWGGMWSLPELAPEADPAGHCRDRFGYVALTQQVLPQLTHSFTHFKLHIRPVQLQLAPRRDTPPGQIWLPLADALDAALPAPIRTLVRQLDRH
ncbi:MAG: A/G-specific adenine glycosylase [Gammaproteobacteria bacterium]|nr:A/G-specific adenine glycosylase [Gammaproteobacteria bacterium]MBU1408955.1 A/G-specific adenine glycosylase [Gammaproteobacteria bacterium]MBU1533624.1 A/G-specific adenine glycosylase [Gammaproteobacteria bacterium]